MPDTPRMRKEQHWDRVVQCYAERPRSLDAMFRATVARSPLAEAVVDGSTRLTYAELDRRVDRVCAGLAARGVKAGDRVAMILDNRFEAVVALLAILRLGAIVMPIGTRLRKPVIAYILADAEPVALIHEASLSGELPEGGFPAMDMRFSVGGEVQAQATTGGTRRPLFADLANSCASAPPPIEIAEEDLFGILYTSGTTGRPKGAMLTHFGAVHSCLHWVEVSHLGQDETTVLCIPWTHVSGLCGVLLPFLHVGGRLVLMAAFDKRKFLETASAERATHALLVPAMYGLCLLDPELPSFDLSSWRLGIFGGAPMPEPTIRRFAQAVPHLVLCNAYGATETTSPATIMPPGHGMDHPDSIGKVVPCGEIRVMDDAGRELPPGQDGEFWIAGPMVVPGYWRNDEANRKSFTGGFWKSGDIGSVDAEGFVRIADRKKDMISRGGFKVYPAEVENTLCEMQGVVEAAVVGRHDEIMGEYVVAFLNVRPSGDVNANALPDEAAIRAFCRERMADYKVPARILIASEPLPRNANGKIQKDPLRQRASQLPPLR